MMGTAREGKPSAPRTPVLAPLPPAATFANHDEAADILALRAYDCVAATIDALNRSGRLDPDTALQLAIAEATVARAMRRG